MDRTLALFAIGLVFGGGIGFVVAAGNGITFDGHDHAKGQANAATAHADAHHAKMHDLPIVVEAEGAPQVAISVTPDPASGYNLHVMTENFTFAPEAASLSHVDGEGHAHVYVNGQKLGRLYGPWYHLGTLPEGDAEVQVTLNSNDHRVFVVEGQQVAAIAAVSVK